MKPPLTRVRKISTHFTKISTSLAVVVDDALTLLMTER